MTKRVKEKQMTQMKMMMIGFNLSVALAVLSMSARGETTGDAMKPIPAGLFGQNLEHCRAVMEGGLSAQLLRNRKFAGKPSRSGVAAEWESYGERGVFDHLQRGFARHAARSAMPRRYNECCSQFVSSLVSTGEAGIRQGGVALRGGVPHTFRAAVRALPNSEAVFVMRVALAGKVLAYKEFPVSALKENEWRRLEFGFVPATTGEAMFSIGVKGKASGVVGVVSLMADDNFHGMRRDVVEHLKEIGTTIVRWPGGNYSGDYRWRDGYIEDRDERAPIQSYMEIEGAPYTYGFDMNDIGPNDVLALCAELGAEPFFTINATWDTPAEAAEWVKRTAGKVKMWSLGNEMGYLHMEGPRKPEEYVALAKAHAEAMLKVDPSLILVQSGYYPHGRKAWADAAAVPLASVAPTVSYHWYSDIRHSGVRYLDFTTPQRTASHYRALESLTNNFMSRLTRFRKDLPPEVKISVDEWNLWYAWYRVDGPAYGLYTMRLMVGFMREWDALNLRDACYFQAVNEQAICVEPFSSHLTSIGEALRLCKGHIGGLRAKELPKLPVELFVTDAPDGSRYATAYNFSTTSPRKFTLPLAGRRTVVSAERLTPTGFEPGNRYRRQPFTEKPVGEELSFTLGPAEMAAVRVK